VLRFILRRLLISIPILLLGSMLVFTLVVNAGDPLEQFRLNPKVTKAQVALREHQVGLDKPITTRYFTWLKGIIHGDFGKKLDNTTPVRDSLYRAARVTLKLVILAQILAVLLGVSIGVLAAVRQYRFFDYFATGTSFLIFAVPTFCVGVLLKEFIAIRLNNVLKGHGHAAFFGTIGEKSDTLCASGCSVGTHLFDFFGHFILPTLTLMLVSFAGYSRYQRASTLETLSSDYVRTARAKGLSERKVIIRHALRNALIPVTTVVALDFGAIVGGAIITERIFEWKGMGSLLVESLTKIDPNVLLGWLMLTAVAVVVFNLIADILYAFLDPRIRVG